MQYIKAPFNFVPVSNEVFYPGWADQISHDVPFSDGLSGQITLTIEAKTPIFIRDSESKTEFCHIKTPTGEKDYFIPGTTLKGMVRSVLEILSFSKLDKINDHRYAIRDLHNSNVYTLMSDSENIRCGWLSLEKSENGIETAKIRDCGSPWRISHQQLDEELYTDFIEKFRRGGTIDFRRDSNKTAKFKYNLCSEIKPTFDDESTNYFESTEFVDNKQLCTFSDPETGSIGTIVLTGQAGPSKSFDEDGNIIQGKSGKFYEFVFIEPTSESEPVILDEKTWRDFKFNYFDHDENKISEDWKWRKGQLKKNKEIPVFFRINDDEPEKVKDMGLSYLYKMPYNHRVKDLLPDKHKRSFFSPVPSHYKPDLAECIFGFTDKEISLKGRVSINPAFVKKDTRVTPGTRITSVFGSPKASYYPIYIVQTGLNGYVNQTRKQEPIYKTFMDDDANLSGSKRYPVKEEAIPRTDVAMVPEKMKVSFIPLNSGAKFETILHYFNLRPVELGAFLSALTFHNNAPKCFHGLGMGKPDGFGRISLKVEGIDNGKIEEYLSEFESEMDAFLSNYVNDSEWYKTPQIKELISMAKLQKDLDDRLEYMILKPRNNINEFAKAKSHERDKRGNIIEEHGFYLERYSKIVQDSEFIRSYSNKELVKTKMEKILEQKKKQLENEKANEHLIALLTKEKELKEKEEQLKKLVTQNKKENTFTLGQVFKAIVSSDVKSVDIPFPEGFINVQLVLTREQKGKPPKPKSEIIVFVKQLKKTGEITQVEWDGK